MAVLAAFCYLVFGVRIQTGYTSLPFIIVAHIVSPLVIVTILSLVTKILFATKFVAEKKDLVLGSNVVCIIICIVLGGLWTNIAMEYRGSNESEIHRPIISATVYFFVVDIFRFNSF